MFDMNESPYTTRRYPVTARKGMVATGNPLAASAGMEILKKGGNAVDAAIATAAALTVVEPTSNGLGSDAFAIVWMKEEMVGLNSSGCAPEALSIEAVKAQGITQMPKHGWTPVTVPGAPKAWAALHERFGKLSFSDVLAPAITYAKEGYPLSPQTARMWQLAVNSYAKYRGDPQFAQWFETFTIDGKAPLPGDMVYLPKHAQALEKIADSKAKAFYEGELADRLEEESRKHHGYLRKSDLMKHEALWVTPLHVRYHGYDVWELPPNGQGIVALTALNILNEFHFAHRDEEMFHTQMEAMKLAFADGLHRVSDPHHLKQDVEELLTKEYANIRAAQITDTAQLPRIHEPAKSGTVYLCTADEEGNMVSYIQSNYMGFGSGIVVDGISLQNRGHDFSLDPTHVNALLPGKRTYHTIIPGFLTKDGRAIGPFGVMGGYMQPQGHVQVLMNMIDFHLNPQQALDAPRWQWVKDKEIHVEDSFDMSIVRQLRKRGHHVAVDLETASFGRGQIIYRLENGVYVGGSESRCDSGIVCW